MTLVIQMVREAIHSGGTQQMSVNEIVKIMQKDANAAALKLRKEEVMDVLDYYKKLQVVYVD